MSKLYPEAKKKEDTRAKVTCLGCGGLLLHDKRPHSWCDQYQKNIQEDEVTKERTCRRFIP